MLASIAAFLQERSSVSGIIYGFLFIGYFGVLVAVSVLLVARFRRRGLIMVGLIILYALINVTADSLSESVARARMASNNSVFRLFLVNGWFAVLFSCLLSAASKMGRRK